MSRLRSAARAVVTKSNDDEVLPCIDLENVEGFTGRLTVDPNEVTGAAGERVLFQVGDVLTSKLRPYLGKAFLADFDGAASSEFVVLRATAGVSSRWLKYVALSSPFIDHAVKTSTGVKMPRSSAEELLRFELLIPDETHQVKIANFLDRETQRMDSAVDTIGLLEASFKARMQSQIDSLVAVPGPTKATVRLSHVADIRFSGVDKHDRPEDQPVQLCNYVDVYRNNKITSDLVFMASTASTQDRIRLSLMKDDVLFTKDSETADDIGVPALVLEDMPDVVLGYHCAMLRPKPTIYGPYLFWLMQSTRMAREWEVAARGVTRVGLRQEDVRRTTVEMPENMSEQQQIARKLEEQSTYTEAILSELDALRRLLAERRQALISAAVTGQLDVEAMV